jgi:hypothetical protein
MTLAEKSAILLRGLSRVRFIFSVAGIFLGVTLAFTALLTWSAYRSVTSGAAPGIVLHPLRFETPFIVYKGPHPAEISALIEVPVYPGAAALEYGSLEYARQPLNPKKAVAVVFLQLRAEVGVTRVDGWYRDLLGLGFARAEGQSLALLGGKEDWERLLPIVPEGRAVLFFHSQPRTTRGVLLGADPSGQGSLITLFYTEESERGIAR